MSQLPPYPPQEQFYAESPYPPPPPPPPVRTSGMAIASLICGVIGLFACCLLLPNVLAIAFGIAAMGVIGRGEAAGRGLAVAGLILGVFGLLIGGAFWIFVAVSPEAFVVSGSDVSAGDRATLEKMGVLDADEQIELFFSSGMFSIKEGGVVLTDQRLTVYGSGQPDQVPLHEITAIDYTPSGNWLDDAQFLVDTDDGRLINFLVSGQQNGDDLFFEKLRQAVTKARQREGLPPPEISEN